MITLPLILASFALRALAQSESPALQVPSTSEFIVPLTTTTAGDDSAQTTVNLFLNTENAFVASVVDADVDATTYGIVCTQGDPTLCNPDVTLTFTQGPTFVSIESETRTNGAQATVNQACDLGGTTSVDCDIEIGFSIVETSTTFTTTLVATGEQASRNFQMVPVTAGVEKLEAAATATETAGGVGMVAENAERVVKVVVPVVVIAVAGVL